MGLDILSIVPGQWQHETLWKRRRSTSVECPTPGAGASPSLTSDGILDGRNSKGLHDRPGLHCLHLNHLAEDLPLPGLRGWLDPRLDHAQPRKDELPGTLHLLRAERSESFKDRYILSFSGSWTPLASHRFRPPCTL